MEQRNNKESELLKQFCSNFFGIPSCFLLKVSDPLMRVLRLVEGEKNPSMENIYEATDRAKETIAKPFDGKEEKYKNILQ